MRTARLESISLLRRVDAIMHDLGLYVPSSPADATQAPTPERATTRARTHDPMLDTFPVRLRDETATGC